MEEFITRQMFAVPSFDLDEKDRLIFNKYYRFLDNSGVAELIKKTVKSGTEKGGRPNVNYFNLFAAVLYGFARGRSTVRDISDACGHDIRFIDIMNQVRPWFQINRTVATDREIVIQKFCRLRNSTAKK